MEKRTKFIIIAIIGTSSFSFFFLFQAGYFSPTNIDSSYCTDCSASVSNITLFIDYGNGTTDSWIGFSLDNYNTSVIDAINKHCRINYRVYGIDHYYVDSINGRAEDASQGWKYWVNDELVYTSACMCV